MQRRVIFLAAGALGAALLAVTRRRRVVGTLEGKVVAITGGSRGLGLALARAFGRRGARVAICGRDETTLRRASEKLSGEGFEVLAHRCDVRNKADVDAFVAAAAARYGRIDLLVNNAGTIEVGPRSAMTDADYADALQTHFWGAHRSVEAALPLLRETRGVIVNVVSIAGLMAVPHLLPYSVSKFALLGYSFALRAELGAEGVSVTTVCPGLMRTGSPRNASFKSKNRSEYAWFAVSDALPFTSISAESAAEQIVGAAVRREALVVLSWQARLLVGMQHAYPSLMLALLGVFARLLPDEGGIGEERARGYESGSPTSESFLTALSRRAEADLNQQLNS